MPSKNGVTAYLEKEDKELFDIAVQLYGIGSSHLAKEIIHSWIFNNRLQLEKRQGDKNVK